MNYTISILCMINYFGKDLTNEVIKYLHNYTEEQGHGCITCKISWYSIINKSTKPLRNCYLYPVIIWHISYYDIGYACSYKCQKNYEKKDLISYENNEREYYMRSEYLHYTNILNKFNKNKILNHIFNIS